MTSPDLIALIKKHPAGLGCGLLSLVLAGMLYTQTSRLDDNQTEFEAKSAMATKILANVNASKNLPEQVAEIQLHTKNLESRLVRAGQLAINLQYFYKLEAENEVKLLNVSQNSLIKNAAVSYSAVPFSVTVQGTYLHVMAFLNRLESGPHFCHFSSVAFSKVNGGTDAAAQTNMTLSLNLELLGQP